MKAQLPGMNQFKSGKAVKSKAVSCKRCRQQKRKCSRERPTCGYCRKHGYQCEFNSVVITKRTGVTKTMDVLKHENIIESMFSPEEAVHKSSFSIHLNSSETTHLNDSKDSIRHEISSKSSFDLSPKSFHSPKDFGHGSPLMLSFPRSSWTPFPDNQIHPNLRTGPVFTNVFNCSLSEKLAMVPDLSLLMSYLPEKKVCDELFDRYRNSIHPIIPVIDVDAICPIYEMFWDNNPVDLEFYIRLFTILYAGSVSAYEGFTLKNTGAVGKQWEFHVERMKHLVGATEIALAMNKFPNEVSITGLQSSVILHYVLRNDCKTDDCGSIANIVRLAQLIELNRDPLKYHGITDNVEVQRRRILWWLIYYLDCVTSLSSKLPPIINPNEYDTQFPNEYFQDYKGEFQFSLVIGFANGRYRWAEITNGILRLNYSVTLSRESINKQMEGVIENFSLYCTSLIEKMLQADYSAATPNYFTSFITSYISSLPDRCQILLLFSCKKNRSDFSSVSNDDVQMEQTTLILLQIHFIEQFMKYGSMPDKAIYLWEIRKYQPIQSLFSLLRSVVIDFKTICSPGGTSSYHEILVSNDRLIDCISKAISALDYLSHNTSPLCEERWELLRELKQSVWVQLFDKFGNNDYSSSDVIDNGEILGLSEKELKDISTEILNSQAIIDECLNAKVWDKDAGHYFE